MKVWLPPKARAGKPEFVFIPVIRAGTVLKIGLWVKNKIIDRILNPGIVAVIRADSSEQLMHVAEALCEGGVTGMEVTMTTPNALQVISDVTKKFGSKILMGVGSVLDPETARAAIACRRGIRSHSGN